MRFTIKILCLLAIVALTTYIGVIFSAKKKKRMLVFAELGEFNERLIINFKFSKNSVCKVAEGFTYIPDMIEGKNPLDGEDGRLIDEYFRNLGKSDALSQIDYLSAKSPTLAKLKDESLSEYKKYSSLYTKIFFMIGVLIAVLLV